MKPRGFEFEEVLTVDPGKSWFDMSYKNRFTCNFGRLYPFYVEESMPGDTFKITSTCFARLQPLLSPVMAHCDVFSYFFYVPNRLLWSNWKKFQSNGDGTVKMADAASYVPPAHPVIDLAYCVDYLVSTIHGTELSWVLYTPADTSDTKVYLGIGKRKVSGMLTRDECLHLFAKYDMFGVPLNGKMVDTNTANPRFVLGEMHIGSDSKWSLNTAYSLLCPHISGGVGTKPNAGEWAGFSTYNVASASDNRQKINAFPFYAYAKIYNEFFRSQDYQDELNDECTDGIQSPNQVPQELLSKAFEHDYFTSILPDAQRGPDVTISLAGTANLVNDTSNFSAHPTQVRGAGTTSSTTLNKQASNNNVADGTGAAVQLDITSHTKVDLTGVSAVTINALRYANTLQKYEEILARSGSRYNEMLISLFGVISSDASIQRPIFLGASRTPVQINDVAQTSSTDSVSPLATLAGRGIAVGDVKTDFYCEENGWLIGVCAVVPRTQYYQGLNRHLRKSVNLDYPVPMFAHLGEQEVYKEELYAGNQISDRNILGYLPRFSEFKYHSDEIHSELVGSLHYWSMTRNIEPGNLSTGAVIDSDFLRADTMNYDAFAVTSSDADHFILDFTNTVHLLRSLPEYSTPSL